MRLQSVKLSKQALTISEHVLGAKHPNMAPHLQNLGMIYTSQSNFKQAEPLFQRALEICMQTLEPEHPTTVKVLENYAFMLKKAKRSNKAKELEARIEVIRVKRDQEASQPEKEA